MEAAVSENVSRALRLSGLAVAIAFVATLLASFGIALGAQQSAPAAVILRTLAALVVLVTGLAWACSAWRDIAGRGFLVTAGISYLLMPLALAGRALIGQFLTGTPLISFFIDAVVWLAVAAWIIAVQLHRHPRREAEVHESLRGLR